MNKGLSFLAVLVLLVAVIWLGVRDTLTPFQRADIRQPVYTVSELPGGSDPSTALPDFQTEQVLVFGPAFWGAFPGAPAFPDVDSARRWLQENGRKGRWGIFRLSGDFFLDTYEREGARHLARTLVVVERVE